MPDLQPFHITQAFNIQQKENELDFFDANLVYDSKLFIDPFLVKLSPISEERSLFDRFGLFFKNAYDKTIRARPNDNEVERLKQHLSFKEPVEVCLGYTQKSNKGSGLASHFAARLINFFLSHAASNILVKDENYPDNKINPNIFAIVSEGLGSDGISDLSACLLMDFLIAYTQEQCKALEIPLKRLPVRQAFDFDELEWTNGMYVDLPENPLREGEPIVFVPKRFLRAEETANAKSKIIGILTDDPHLNERFSTLLSKNISELSLQEIVDAVMRDDEAETILKQYIRILEAEGANPYDFNHDALGMMVLKKFDKYFDGKVRAAEPRNCNELLSHTKSLIEEFNQLMSQKDGWKEQWYEMGGALSPNKEVVFGRWFRAMGYAYFKHLPDVTFLPEVDTGNGCADFCVIHRDCRITIEVKKLLNANLTGPEKIPAYLHGIKKQLPQYTIAMNATYAFYMTGQHYKETGKKNAKNHTPRTIEIQELIPETEAMIKASIPHFQNLFYINVDLSPRPSASKS